MSNSHRRAIKTSLTNHSEIRKDPTKCTKSFDNATSKTQQTKGIYTHTSAHAHPPARTHALERRPGSFLVDTPVPSKIVKISDHEHLADSPTMASNLDQFADLELSKEDREQIFDPPLDAPKTQNGAR